MTSEEYRRRRKPQPVNLGNRCIHHVECKNTVSDMRTNICNECAEKVAKEVNRDLRRQQKGDLY
jgi:hypothetical protein